jgi:hypothetical protein
MKISRVETGCVYLDEHLVGSRLRGGPFFYDQLR